MDLVKQQSDGMGRAAQLFGTVSLSPFEHAISAAGMEVCL